LINAHGTDALYEEILDAARSILRADFASIQMFYPERGTNGELRLLGHRGFSAEAAKRWEWVLPSSRTTCGEALRTRKRVFVPDVRNCDFMSGSEDLEGYLSSGIHAVQTTPLVSRSGELLGMVSTHWRQTHELSASELSALDVLARMAADLIDRSRVEEALRASEAQARAKATELQAIMDAAPANIFIARDAECRHLSGNRNAYLSLRLPLGSNLSMSASPGERPQNLRVMLHGAEIPPQEMPVQRAALTGRAVRNSEVEVVFEDGTSIDLLGNAEPLLDDNGRPRGAVGVLSDITERKQAEAKLRESEERFRNMADAAPVMIWVSGPDKRRIFFNKAWLDFTGRNSEQERGNEWAAGIHPEDRERYFATYDSSFDGRRNFQIEYRIRRCDGEYRWVLCNGAPLYRRVEFAGFIGSCTDITHQKLVEERLRAKEVQFLDAQRLAQLGGWELDIVSNKVHWSDEMFRIFGISNDPPSTV
jgi:PAS domain S-box-containing protein